MLTLIAQAAQQADESWLTRHSTLIVGVVGIIISGFVGPTVTAIFTAGRERAKDARALSVGRRDDLRALLDEAAKALAAAVPNLRPLLDAQLAGREPPKEPADFLRSLVALDQRLRLRARATDPVVQQFEKVRAKLLALSRATGSQADWDSSVEEFEAARAMFLDAGRAAVQAPISEEGT
jgi:hypothetical protein